MERLTKEPRTNAQISFASGKADAQRNRYRGPVDSMVGHYNDGWKTVRPLPGDEATTTVWDVRPAWSVG